MPTIQEHGRLGHAQRRSYQAARFASTSSFVHHAGPHATNRNTVAPKHDARHLQRTWSRTTITTEAEHHPPTKPVQWSGAERRPAVDIVPRNSSCQWKSIRLPRAAAPERSILIHPALARSLLPPRSSTLTAPTRPDPSSSSVLVK